MPGRHSDPRGDYYCGDALRRPPDRCSNRSQATRYLHPVTHDGGRRFHGAWVASSGEQAKSVVHVDPATHQVVGKPIPVGLEPIQLVTGTTGTGAVWVGSHSAGIVTRMDPETGEAVATIDVGFPVYGLGAGPDAVWAADYHGSKAVRTSPVTNQVAGEPV